MGPSGWQIIVVLVIILLLFGGRKIPELAKGLGEGIKNFKSAVNEEGEKANPSELSKNDNIKKFTETISDKKEVKKES